MPALRPIRSHTALRGVAALLVMAYHLQLGPDEKLPFETATPFFHRGYLWVDLFFILSGFILSYVNRAEIGLRFGRRDVAAFLRSRFARVYPLHIGCLAAYTAILAVLTIFTAATGRYPPADWSLDSIGLLIAQALLVNAWIADASGWNIPTWSISAEAVAYLLFPLLVTARTLRPRLVPAATGAMVCGFFGYVAATTGTLDVIGGPFAILRCLAGFLLGMLVYQARGLFAQMRDRWLSIAQAVAVVCSVAVLAADGSDPAAIPFFALLVGATWQDRGLLPRLLDRRPMLWLGEVSYSIYLLHVPVLAILGFGWGRLTPRLPFDPEVVRGLLIVLAFTVVLGLASLTYRFVERPARQWLARRMLGHGVPSIATSPAAP